MYPGLARKDDIRDLPDGAAWVAAWVRPYILVSSNVSSERKEMTDDQRDGKNEVNNMIQRSAGGISPKELTDASHLRIKSYFFVTSSLLPHPLTSPLCAFAVAEIIVAA